jgi:hypothetical protein
MARQRYRRAIRSGLLKIKGTGIFRVQVPLRVACAHCGVEFQPERTTARFCSPRCRVAFNRAKKQPS